MHRNLQEILKTILGILEMEISFSGMEGSHSYELPGKYLVTLTVTSSSGNSASIQTEVIVNFDGFVISDNMECTCAPTAKVTQIDLKSRT
ncbi:MAG: PKD domain-containing protein [Candidatus Poseidoniales archaeon]